MGINCCWTDGQGYIHSGPVGFTLSFRGSVCAVKYGEKRVIQVIWIMTIKMMMMTIKMPVFHELNRVNMTGDAILNEEGCSTGSLFICHLNSSCFS